MQLRPVSNLEHQVKNRKSNDSKFSLNVLDLKPSDILRVQNTEHVHTRTFRVVTVSRFGVR